MKFFNRSINILGFSLAISVCSAQEPGGIPVNTNFDIRVERPADKRERVATLADTSLIDPVYIGLMSYVVDEKMYYIRQPEGWVKFETGSASVDSTFGVSTYLIEANRIIKEKENFDVYFIGDSRVENNHTPQRLKDLIADKIGGSRGYGGFNVWAAPYEFFTKATTGTPISLTGVSDSTFARYAVSLNNTQTVTLNPTSAHFEKWNRITLFYKGAITLSCGGSSVSGTSSSVIGKVVLNFSETIGTILITSTSTPSHVYEIVLEDTTKTGILLHRFGHSGIRVKDIAVGKTKYYLNEYAPDLTLIRAGANGITSVPYLEQRDSMQAIINNVGQGEFIIVGETANATNTYNQLNTINALYSEMNYGYCDLYTVVNDWTKFYDAGYGDAVIHENKDGAVIIAQRIYDKIYSTEVKQRGKGLIKRGGDDIVYYNAASNGKLDSTALTMQNLHSWSAGQDNVTGYLKVTLPSVNTASYFEVFIDVFNYVSGKPFQIFFSGYEVTGTVNSANGYIVSSDLATSNLPYKLGVDGTGKLCLYIGTASTLWRFPHVVVSKVNVSVNNATLDKWYEGWKVECNPTNPSSVYIDFTYKKIIAEKSSEINGTGNQARCIIYAPSAGTYQNNTSSVTGFIRVKFPSVVKDYGMVTLAVNVFNYDDNTSFQVVVSGFSAATYFVEGSSYIIGNHAVQHKIRVGYEGSERYLYIGEAYTVWNFLGVSIAYVDVGYWETSIDNWKSGWTIGVTTTDLSAVHYTNLTPNSWNAGALKGVPISATAPTTGQVLSYDGTNYTPASVLTASGTANIIPKFTSSSTIGNSTISTNAGNTKVGINTTNPLYNLHVKDSYGGIGLYLESDWANYTPASIVMQNKANTTGSNGIFLLDSLKEWFAGVPYSNTDAFVFNRFTNTTGNHSYDAALNANTIFKIQQGVTSLYKDEPYYDAVTTNSGSIATPSIAGFRFRSNGGQYYIGSITGVSRASNVSYGDIHFNVSSAISGSTFNEVMRLQGLDTSVVARKLKYSISSNANASGLVGYGTDGYLKNISVGSGLNLSSGGILTSTGASKWSDWNTGRIYRNSKVAITQDTTNIGSAFSLAVTPVVGVTDSFARLFIYNGLSGSKKKSEIKIQANASSSINMTSYGNSESITILGQNTSSLNSIVGTRSTLMNITGGGQYGWRIGANDIERFKIMGDSGAYFVNLPTFTTDTALCVSITGRLYKCPRSTGGGGGSTDLTFSGSSSPVTLNSSSGTDVTLTAGTNVTFSQASNNLTINATGLTTSGSNGDIQIKNGSALLHPAYVTTKDSTLYFKDATGVTSDSTGIHTFSTSILGGSSEFRMLNKDWESTFNERFSYVNKIEIGASPPSTWYSTGGAATNIGSLNASSTIAFTNILTRQHRVGFTAGASTTAVAGYRISTSTHYLSNNSNYGGFYYTTTFGFDGGLGVASRRSFTGLWANTSNNTDIDLQTMTNCVGLIFDANNANWQFAHNDASGSVTLIDVGFAKPSSNGADLIKFEMYAMPNSMVVYFKYTNIANGDTFTSSASTNLPVVNTPMAVRAWQGAGNTSTAVHYAMSNTEIRSIREK